MTSRLIAHILNKLLDERSFSYVARECNMSVSTVIRIFDCISYTKVMIMLEAVVLMNLKVVPTVKSINAFYPIYLMELY